MQGFAYGFRAAFAGVAVKHNIFDDHDRIIDHQADGGGKAAQRHQIEALADEPQHQHRYGDRDRDDQTGNERRSPVAQEEVQDDAGQHQADDDGVTHTGDAFAYKLRLVIEGLQHNAPRQLAA